MGTKVKELWSAAARKGKIGAAIAAVFGLVFGFSLIVPTRASAASGDDYVQMTASFVSCQIKDGSMFVTYNVTNKNPSVDWVRINDTYPGGPLLGTDVVAYQAIPSGGATHTTPALPHPDVTHEINFGATNGQGSVYAYQVGDFFVNPSQCSGGQPPVIKHVTAPNPTKVDAYGTANDTYTIPSAEGVQYYVAGQSVASGTHSTKGAPVVNVTAQAKSGYVLDNAATAKWTLTFTDVPAPPTCQSDLSGIRATVSHTNSGLVTYSATIPKPACSKLNVYGDTYTLPSTYDGSGKFNKTASPQHYVPSARTVPTIPKGQTSVTETKSFASALVCGVNWLQPDVYKGPQQEVVNYPQGSNGYLAGGPFKVVYDGSECHPAPPTKVTDENVTIMGFCGVNNDKPVPSTSADYTSVISPWKDSKVSVTFTMKSGVNKVFVNGKKSITITKDEVDTSACFPTSPPSIMAKGSCDCKVKFSNPNGFPVEVWAGNKSMSHIDEHFVVSAHGSKVVKTTRTTLYYQIAWKGGNAAETVYSVNVPQNCGTPTPTPTSSTTQPTSPSSSPSPSSPSSTSTGTPTSTSSGTPTSTATGTPSSTSSSSSKPGHSNSSTATSTSMSGRSSSSKTTGPPVITDGPAGSSGSNTGTLISGGVVALLGALAVFWGWRRLSN